MVERGKEGAMIRGLCVVILLSILVGVAQGQEQQTLEGTLMELSKDLATLNQDVQNAYAQMARPPGLAAAYSLLDYKVRITEKNSPIRAGAADNAWILTRAAEGKSFKVIDKAGQWYAVALDKPAKGLSTGWVKASEAIPEVTPIEPGGARSKEKPITEFIYEKITESVTAIRNKYKNNQYLKVTGFSVSVAVPPSVTVSFEFK
jgi:hypothetical protein